MVNVADSRVIFCHFFDKRPRTRRAFYGYKASNKYPEMKPLDKFVSFQNKIPKIVGVEYMSRRILVPM